MSEQLIKDILGETVAEVLEQTAFVFPEPADMTDGVALEDYEMITVKIVFSGDTAGFIMMLLPTEFCGELAANLLGEDVDEADAVEAGYDSAKEMLNIIAGQMLTRVYGDKAVFNLSAPTVEKNEHQEVIRTLTGDNYSFCMVDDYPVITIFTLGEKVSHEHQSIGS